MNRYPASPPAWRRPLEVSVAALLLMAAVGPMPDVLGLGAGLAAALKIVAILVFSERAFGSEVRDYVAAVWLTGGLVGFIGRALASGEVEAAAWVVEASLFVGTALFVRWMRTFEPDVVTEERTDAELDAQRAAGVPLADAMAAQPWLADGVALLRARLTGSPLEAMLGLKGVDLVDLLGFVRVVPPPSGPAGMLFSARYLPFNRTLMVRPGRRSAPVVAHELLHAAHHAAVMRAITVEDLIAILSLLDRARTAQFIDDRIDEVTAGLAQPGPLSETLRWAGADLLFYAKLEDKAPMEAVGSYFDGGVARYVEKVAYYVALPFAVLAGMNRRNGIFQSFAGYLNRAYIDDMVERGLVRALVEPRGF